uniref:uncharacterized protein lrrfip1a isoform X5 n=1 Tax=Monopterus albus TaxID=43700 RepID=UPI0009B34625|nr:uncharacterized protein LOC109963749 isoform X5 [Monopterus albus]
MGTQGTGRKRSTKKERSTAEDDALNLIAREAEARLAAKRAARAEAREIRMKELERQQKEIFQVQKKYYGLSTTLDDRADRKWGDIEQWMEDSERYSRSSQMRTFSDDDERMSVGSRGSVRGSHKKSKKKKKYKDKDRNGCDDDYSVMSSRSSRLSDDSRPSRASRLDLQPSSLYEDGLCSGSRRVAGSSSHPLDYTSYRSSGSRTSSRAGSARASPVDNCSSVASYLRSAAGSSGLRGDLDSVTIPDFSDVSRFALARGRGCDVEDKDYLEKGSRAASTSTGATLTSLGGTSSRRGSGDTAISVDTENSIREIKEIHELKDQIEDVEAKYTQNLKEVKDALAEAEEKYRKAMVSNAQLDNEKNNLMYQVDTLKDSLMELEELLSESRREYEEKVKEFEREKHAHSVLQFQFSEVKETLKQSEELLNENRQLRMKQDGFVREVSDLQETLEWKDKKIGALERQKEYTDAIRIERDELREEVVKVKDILKKHGIVLGPDLNINGDIGEAEVDGPPSGDSAPSPAQESLTSPTEGNSILGSTEKNQLRSSREEDMDPGQHEEMLNEETSENHLSSDVLCNAGDVNTLETPSKEQPTEEQQTCLSTEEDGVGENGLNKDLNVSINDHSVTESKDVIICSPEESALETETHGGGDSGETSNPDLGETETKSSSVDIVESCNKVFEEQENKEEDTEESKLRNTESCHQQKVIEDVRKENLPDGSISAVSNTEPQQEPENAEEAENDETEELSSKTQPQGAPTSGKKKKKKKRSKKKGGTHEDKNQQKHGTEKESKTEEGIQSAKRGNGSATEPKTDGSVSETFKESKMDQISNEQGVKGTEKIDAVEAVEPTETFLHKEVRMDHVTNERDKEQSLEAEKQTPTETLCHIESRDEPTKDRQGKEETLESEKVEEMESVTSPCEASVSMPDLTDTSNSTESTGFDKLHNSKSGDISANSEDIHSESQIVYHREDEVGSDDELKPEFTSNPESSLETNGKEDIEAESHLPSNCDVAADESESTNRSERKDDISVLPPFTYDFSLDLKSSSVSEPPSEPYVPRKSLGNDILIKVSDVRSEEEAAGDDEEPRTVTEQLCFSPSVTSPSHDDYSELKQDSSSFSVLTGNLRESEDFVKTDGSSYDEQRDSLCPLETVAQAEQLEDMAIQTLVCVDFNDDSNMKVSWQIEAIKTTDMLNMPDSPKEAVEIGSSVKWESAVAKDPEHKTSPDDKESETSLCPLAEQLQESSKDESEDNAVSQPNQRNSDEEDGDDEEGQSFDFDDMDMEAAIATSLPKNPDQEIVEEGAEVISDQSTETNKNMQDRPVESSDEKRTVGEDNQEATPHKESDNTPQGNNNSSHEEAMSAQEEDVENVCEEQVNTPKEEMCIADEARDVTEEGKVLIAGELGDVAEDINQATSEPVEEELDAIKHEVQGEALVLPKSADQVGSSTEPPQSGKDVKKNGKKGKGKEDCKMS